MKTYNKIYFLLAISNFLLMGNTGNFFAQTPISLEIAYQKAIGNNPELKAGQLRIDYHDKVKNSYKTTEPMNVAAEIGQLNSAYIDNKVLVNQSFRLPGFYKGQKQVLIEESKNAVLGLDVQKWKLKKELALLYNELNYQNEKQKLLKKTDSIYSNYYRRAELRLKKGESNILEKTTAENYRAEAKIQLENLLKDREMSLYQFNFLINEDALYTAQNADFYQQKVDDLISNYKGNSILLGQLDQQKANEKAKLQAEKSKLKPNFTIGYGNSSMYGMGADDRFYDRSKRFHSGMIGVGIPIFNSAQKSLIEGQKVNQQIAENNYEIGLRTLQNQFQSAYLAYEKLLSEQDYYKTKGLENAKTILDTANRLYYEGEINYLEWSILVNQSLTIENTFIDNQKMLNEKVIELNSLMSENL